MLWSVMTDLQDTVRFDSLTELGLGGFDDCQGQNAIVDFPTARPNPVRPRRDLPNSDIPKTGEANGLGCLTAK